MSHNMSSTNLILVDPVLSRVQTNINRPEQVPHLNVNPVISRAKEVKMEGAGIVLNSGKVVYLIMMQCKITGRTVTRITSIPRLTGVTLVKEAVVSFSAPLRVSASVAAARVVLTLTVQARVRVTLPRVFITRARATLLSGGISEVVRRCALLAVISSSVVLTV